MTGRTKSVRPPRGPAPRLARARQGGASGPIRALALLAALSTGCAHQPAGPTPGSPAFDGQLALDLVQRQVDFGPRVPGTPGHAAQLEWMLARLDSLAPVVEADTFTHVTTNGADTLTLVNVQARFRPELGRRIVVLAHWDTRPTADEEPDSTLRDIPIPGANDGASGTAVILVLAGLLAGTEAPLGVDLLLVDGEDYGPGLDDMLLGARRYADTIDEDARPIYGVLLDMVGDADGRFPVEGYSAQAANPVVQKVWRAAERLGYREAFPTAVGQDLTDDHVPLIQAGIPTANVIDFSYGPGNAWWHTSEDRPDKLSAETLGMVGAVITELIYSGG